MGRSFSEEIPEEAPATAPAIVENDGEVVEASAPSPLTAKKEDAHGEEEHGGDDGEALNPNNWRGISYDSRRKKWQSKVHFGCVQDPRWRAQ